MPNPKGCSKKSLLLAVTELNTRCGTKLRVTSKKVADIVDSTELALQEVTCLDILSKLSTPTLGELFCWGFITDKFFGEQEIPEFAQNAQDNVDENTVQAGETKQWNESAVQKEEEQLNNSEEADESKLSKKERKALKKARKKAAKEAKDNPPPEEKVPEDPPKEDKKKLMDPGEVQSLDKRDLKLLAGDLGVDLDLKKKKMIKACVIALIAAHEEPEKKKKPTTKRSGPGVIISIKNILEDTDKPLGFDDILKQLCERIPTGNPDTMVKTIRAQIAGKQPCRLEKEKDCKIKVKGEKNERTFIIK